MLPRHLEFSATLKSTDQIPTLIDDRDETAVTGDDALLVSLRAAAPKKILRTGHLLHMCSTTLTLNGPRGGLLVFWSRS